MLWSYVLRFGVITLLGFATRYAFWYCHCIHRAHAGLFMVIGAVIATEHFTPTRKDFLTAAVIILLTVASAPILFGHANWLKELLSH